ncbi:ATP-dependent 6-phosphofructokinase, muscle type-like isoform X3 [Actinia tenebrosa]|uniref:ATP-dependent 6-phosphofructokinase n=1 Tax=Actinia tenebrosa TaxID=6105 RepID=A0A6P8ISZ0_ACTTE|nr:ATP-dependent 6-phosphofructokinase, muscle type-like isoform X3 [Actinia tenebrosa]
MSQLLIYLISELTCKLLHYLNLSPSGRSGNMSRKRRPEDSRHDTDSGEPVRKREHRPLLRSRQPSLIAVDGFGQCIGVLTSGGDAQGMNAAIRAVVRMGLYANARVFTIWEGYQGLVDGGDNIKEVSWYDVSGIIQQGGTIIGSARCQDFRVREGRLKAANNMIEKGITNLVIIGGDGSLTGANCFRQEWQGLLDELVTKGSITAEKAAQHKTLNIVGMVGSIDNDFCGTDMTIGTDSALHRIFEASDAILTTATSHQRTFVLEVMGRHCGYLALVSSVGIGADYVFIPEWPAEDGWEERMCRHLHKVRLSGRRLCIVIVAEGAQDVHGNGITSNQIKDIIKEKLSHDTRVTVLGHVQRGGAASAFDRVLSCRMGAEAALAVLEANSYTPPSVICLDGNKIVKKPLMECVEKTLEVQKAMKNREFDKVVHLRGRTFERNLQMFKRLRKVEPPADSLCNVKGDCDKDYKLAVMNIGAPAGGMNAAVRAFVRGALYEGHEVLGVKDGIDGLLAGQVQKIGWLDVDGWSDEGGAKLGTTRTTASSDMAAVARQLEKYDIKGILIVGGFEAFKTCLEMAEARDKHPECCIPIVVIPAVISNNVPGTDLCIGADTALNVIVEICDQIKMSALSSFKRVFVVECMGGYCGYLATMGALASGADAAYIFEENFTLQDLLNDVTHLKSKMKGKIRRGLVLRNEMCNKNYTADFITKLFSEEGEGVFSTRQNVLGHVQQGGQPSPFDRIQATRQATIAVDWILEKIRECRLENGSIQADSPDTACVLGIKKSISPFTPVQDLKEVTDFEHRLPDHQWWLSIRPLMRILAKHRQVYHREEDM